MTSIEQKRLALEKALSAIHEDEMEEVAGGMSDDGKKALKIGGEIAGSLLGAVILGAGAYGAYRHAVTQPWGKKPGDSEDYTPDYTSLGMPTTPAEQVRKFHKNPDGDLNDPFGSSDDLD